MVLSDGVTPLNAANIPHKSGTDAISGQWNFTKAVATPGGFNFTANGDLETWNAGTAVAPTDYTLVGAGATIAREAGAGNFRTGLYAAALTRVGTDCYLKQDVLVKAGPVAIWLSKTVVLGCWVKASAANRARIGVYDGAAVTYSPYHSGGGAYEFLSVTLTLGGGITALELRLAVDTGNTTAYFDGLTFALGSGLTGDSWPSGLPTTAAAASVSSLVPIAGQAANLWIRNHPNMLTSGKSVVQITADDIVFNDGTKVPTWSLSLDITVAGANGLDTGAETANAWYSVHAIRKSSDGTKAGLLHRAPFYSMNTNYETGQDGSHMLRRSTAPVNTKLSQGFQVGASSTLPFIIVKLLRAGAITAGQKIWFTIETDSAGKPSGTVLATSDELEAVRIPTAPATGRLVLFAFRTPPALTSGTQYHMVLQGDVTASDTINVLWFADTTAATYANGAKAFYDGAVWTTDTDDDFIFRAFIDQGTSALTLPGGYDQYTPPLSYVYNNGAGDFLRFFQRARHWKSMFPSGAKLQRTGLTALAQSEVLDISTLVPPLALEACFVLSTTTAYYLSLGHHSAVDAGGNSAVEGAYAYYNPIAAATFSALVTGKIPVEFQYMQVDSYYDLHLWNSEFEVP